MSQFYAPNKVVCTPEMEIVLRSGRTQPVQSFKHLGKLLSISGETAKRVAADLGLDTTSPVLRIAPQTGDEWSEIELGLLRSLWASGMSTTQIGKRMDRTKNAIIGKARRLGLAARPSPIKRDVERKPRPPRVGQTIKPKPPKDLTIARRAQGGYSTLTRTLPLPSARVMPVFVGPTTNCCWPMWGKNERAGYPVQNFCCEPSVPGRSYCPTHYKRAYIQKPLPEVSNVAA